MPNIRILLLASLALSQACWAAGQVYKSVGPNGVVTYSDTPPASGPAQVMDKIRARSPVPENDPVTASIMVYSIEIIVETSYRFCRDSIPESAQLVLAARDKWMERHASLRARKIEVLKDRLSNAELHKLSNQFERDNEDILDKIRRAPRATQSEMCNAAPRTFAAPKFDLAANLTLVDTIMNYRPKR